MGVTVLGRLRPLLFYHVTQVGKIAPGPNRRLVDILYTAAAPARIEFYFNNSRMRHAMPMGQLQLLPSGTASNEALHAEVRLLGRLNRSPSVLSCSTASC